MAVRHDDVKDEDIIIDYRAGMSFRQLAKKYGMGVKSIAYRLKRNNIEQREGSQKKYGVCINCDETFEMDVWSRQTTCGPECREKHRIQKIRNTYIKKSAKFKYPWGSYILEGIKELVQEVVDMYPNNKVIPLPLIYDHFRYKIGCRLVDPVIRNVIVTEMTSKGYVYERQRFVKKKK